MTVQQRDLQFRFKGERRYVHGTDILNQTLAMLRGLGDEPRDIDISFHRLATRQPTALWGEDAQAVEPASVCSFTAGGVRQKLLLVERDEEVTGRYAYPEDEIVRAMRVDASSREGVLAGHPGYTEIEVLVAMTKALHQQVFPAAAGKWLFARGRFPQYAEHLPAAARSIRIAASFNGKLTRSVATADGSPIGGIFFALA